MIGRRCTVIYIEKPVRRSNGAVMAPFFLAVVLLIGSSAFAQSQQQTTPPATQTPKVSGNKQIAPDLNNDLTPRNSKQFSQKAQRLMPTTVYVQEGDKALRNGDMTAATRSYVQAVLASPRDPALRLSAGVALAESGMLVEAANQFRQALRFAENDVIAALMLQNALTELGAGAEAQDIYQDTYRRFARPGKDGLDVNTSIARLTDAIKRYQDSPIYYLLLGDAYQYSENWIAADRHYQKAISLAPLWSKPLVNMGLSYLAQGQTERAITYFESALKLDPRNRMAQRLKITGQGQAYANAGNFPKAIVTLTNAQKAAPKDPTPSVMIAQIETQNGNLTAAADAYNTALRITRSGGLFAQRAMIYRNLAETLLTAQQPDKAKAILQQALNEEPTSASLWYRLLAQSNFALKYNTQGMEMLKAALDNEPGPYPADTLNAIDARGLMPAIKETYQKELAEVTDGVRTGTTNGGGISITIIPPAQRSPGRQIRPLVALAHIARYQRDFREEVRLRSAVTELRANPWDWFLMAETYDLRIVDPVNARESYLKALEVSNKIGILSEATKSFARKRLENLTSPAFDPK